MALDQTQTFQTPTSIAAHNMDDINMLLYLEALKRSVENRNDISHKVEEAYKAYQKRYSEYATLYAKYVALVKKASTRKLLDEKWLTQLNLAAATEDVKCIKERLVNDVMTDSINQSDLETFKQMLGKCEKCENLKDVREQLMELKKITESIQASIEAVEAGIETGANMVLDLAMGELDMANFPQFSEANENAE